MHQAVDYVTKQDQVIYKAATEPKLAIFTSHFLVEDNFPTSRNSAQGKDQCPQ